jgi:hypothetical protein
MTPQRWLVLVAFAAANCSAQIVNGSFESPALISTQNYFGAFSFTGWSGISTGGTGNAGLVVGTDYGLSPFDGNQAFAFNGNDPAPGTYIEQTFNTSLGQSYAVAFAVGRNGDPSSQALALQVDLFNAGGSVLATLSATPPNANSYSGYGFTFTASSATSRLRFTDVSASNPFTDVFVDGVRVSAVPEQPSTFALLGCCLLILLRKRKRKLHPGS